MAYKVSDGFVPTIYSGDVRYDCKLYFDEVLIPVEQIVYIKISSPIIDTSAETGKVFHIGTFPSQKIEIKFRNLEGINVGNNPEISLTIGVLVNGEYEYVPIGKYLIDELDENYQKTCIITALDYALIMKTPLDISQFFDQEEEIPDGDGNFKKVRYVKAIDLFPRICSYYGLNSTTTTGLINRDKKIYQFDNTITGKQYISYLAELMGGNAKITRDKKVIIYALNKSSVKGIEIQRAKSFEVGQTFEISRVVYEAGKIKFYGGKNIIYVNELPTENIDTNSYYFILDDQTYYAYENNAWVVKTDMKNTLYLRTDNLFITSQEEVANIYNTLAGVKITNLKCENRMDISLDAWDKVNYYEVQDGAYVRSYITFYDNEIMFNGVMMGKTEVKIPFLMQKELTNVITNPTEQLINRVKVEIDEQNGAITSLSQRVGEAESKVIQMPDQIINRVQGQLVTQGEFGDYKHSVETEFKQTKEGWDLSWLDIKDDYKETNDKIEENDRELKKYIRFIDGNIILGKTDSKITLKISNDRIFFLQSGKEVAYMSDNILYIFDGNFLNSLRIGNFAFIPRANGSLDFRYTGGV